MSISIPPKAEESTFYNRCRMEWKKVMTPYEYTILDTILYKYNHKKANDGKGWDFHIREIAESSNVSPGQASKVVKLFPFMEKVGNSKSMTIKFNQPRFEKWIETKMKSSQPKGKTKTAAKPIIQDTNDDCSLQNGIVSNGNNDCFPGKPRSIKQEVVPKSNSKNTAPGLIGLGADSIKSQVEPKEAEPDSEYKPASLEAETSIKSKATKMTPEEFDKQWDAIDTSKMKSVAELISAPASAGSGAVSIECLNPSADVRRVAEGIRASTVPAGVPGEVTVSAGKPEEVAVPSVKTLDLGFIPVGKTVEAQIQDLEKRLNKHLGVRFDSHGGNGHSFAKGIQASMYDSSKKVVLYFVTSLEDYDKKMISYNKLKSYCKTRCKPTPRALVYATFNPKQLLALLEA